jgi:hypothetical protein
MAWEDLRKEIIEIFQKKSKKLCMQVKMELDFIEDPPIVDEYVYGEAFPNENRIWLQVVAPYASIREITMTICHELVHLKNPTLNHDSKKFENLVRNYMKN